MVSFELKIKIIEAMCLFMYKTDFHVNEKQVTTRLRNKY